MRALKLTLKTVVYTLAVLLLMLALCVQVVRTGLYFVDDYHPHIERFLSERLSSDVSLGSISASWYGLRPTIEINNLKIVSRVDASTVEASNAFVVFDLSDTFLQLAPVFKHVRFADLTLSLSQDEQGAWGAAGFITSKERSSGTWRYRSPADLFSSVQFAELKNTQLNLQFYDGRTLETVFPFTDITNDGDNHYLNISAAIDGEAEVFSIQIEGLGRPSQPDEFKAKALVTLKQFPAERLSRLLFLDDTLAVDEFDSATLDGQFWFDFDTTRHFSMSGDFSFSGNRNVVENNLLPEKPNAIAVNNFADFYQVPLKAIISADYQFNEGIKLGVQNIRIDNDIALSPIEVSWVGNEAQLLTEKLELEPLANWFVSRFSPSKVTEIVSAMAPRGELDHLRLVGEMGDASSFKLQAYANAVAIDGFEAVPQFKNVSGFIETSIKKGSILLDSKNFSMLMQPFYKQAIRAEDAQGEISWELSPADNYVNIQGKHLSAKTAFGRLNSFFELELPWQPNTSDSHLNLQLGLVQSNVKYAELLLPTVLPSDLSDWIKSAVKQGDVNTAGVLYRGGFKEEDDRAIQLYLDIEDAQLAYQPDWPVLNNVSTEIIFDDRQLVASVSKASSYDDEMTGIISWNTQSQQRLSIQAEIDSSAQSALRFVENSPLKQQVGDTFSDWELGGDVNVGLDLLFGLGDGDDFSSQLAEITLSDNRLYLPQQNLEVNNANGTVFYSSVNGFSSSSLNGLLFGEQALLDMETQDNGDLLLTGSGAVNVGDLSAWLEQPLLSRVSEGVASYTFDFLIQDVAAQDNVFYVSDADNTLEAVQKLSIYSDLNNVSIDLPFPFGKSLDESKDLALEATFKNDTSHYKIQLENTLYSEVTFVGDEDFTSIVQLGDQPFVYTPKSLPAEAQSSQQGLFIFGEFSTLNIESWLPFFQTIESMDDGSSESFPVYYDVKATSLEFMESEIFNATVLGHNNSDVWENIIASDNFAGNVYYREADVVPLTINLDYLLLPKKEDGGGESSVLVKEQAVAVNDIVDPFADMDFADIPSAAVAIKYLEYDNKQLGAWSFDLDAQADVILVNNIQGEAADIQFTGLMKGEGGSLRWSRYNGQDLTTLAARMAGGNLSELFELWGLPPSIKNQRSHAAINMAWSGSPAAIRVASVNGDIDFLLENGTFVQASGGATGFLRILGFLNFDTWIKRLRLNFSGMLDEGMKFDNVSGRLNFKEGIIQLSEPVEVNGDSVSISLSGFIDYPQDSIDGNLAVVLPVGGNLNLAAALAAGLPAAVGVYLVRQIFKDALDKASTVNYLVSGSLDKPSITFDRSGSP